MRKMRMVVLDLDGTALRGDKSVSAYTRAVLRACRQKGIHVVVATARGERDAQKYVDAICPDALISSGGALARCGQRVVYRAMLAADTAEALLQALRQAPGMRAITMQTDSGYFSTQQEPDDPDYAHALPLDLTKPQTEDAYKITVECAREEAIRAIAARFPQCGMHAFSDGCWYRFADRRARKMEAIRAVAQQQGVDLTQIAAFGDDFNDVEMLGRCGAGIAMGNAIAQAKEAADFVCGTNDEDGAAQWIERFVLRGETKG